MYITQNIAERIKLKGDACFGFLHNVNVPL